MGWLSDLLSGAGSLAGIDVPSIDVPDELVDLGGSSSELGSNLAGLMSAGVNPGDFTGGGPLTLADSLGTTMGAPASRGAGLGTALGQGASQLARLLTPGGLGGAPSGSYSAPNFSLPAVSPVPDLRPLSLTPGLPATAPFTPTPSGPTPMPPSPQQGLPMPPMSGLQRLLAESRG